MSSPGVITIKVHSCMNSIQFACIFNSKNDEKRIGLKKYRFQEINAYLCIKVTVYVV